MDSPTELDRVKDVIFPAGADDSYELHDLVDFVVTNVDVHTELQVGITNTHPNDPAEKHFS